jgi:hypothetical protein
MPELKRSANLRWQVIAAVPIALLSGLMLAASGRFFVTQLSEPVTVRDDLLAAIFALTAGLGCAAVAVALLKGWHYTAMWGIAVTLAVLVASEVWF